jgi:ribosome-associated protein
VRRKNRLKEYDFIFNALADKRGLDILGLDMEESSAISDTFILVTANSDIHMNTLRDAAVEALRARGLETSVEGSDSSQWRLIDGGGEVTVHIFSKTGRDHYRLDKLWGDAPSYHFTYRE